MKLTGSFTLPVPVDRAYAALQDPALLAQCIPGCEKLDATGPDEYAMKMKMALAAVSGAFDGKIKITDQNPPASYTMMVEGQGKIGFMKGSGQISLAPSGEAETAGSYEGDVQVGGTIAAVGQRLIDTTSKMMIKRFFDKLATLIAS